MKMAQNTAHVGIDVSQAELVVYIDLAAGRRIRHRRPVESATLGRVSAPPYTGGR